MKARAWAPGHVTGFFEIFLKNKWRLSGSRGAGINLSKGIEAIAEVKESNRNKVDAPGISKEAINELLKRLPKRYKIKISFKKEIPTGQGLGASGAEVISSLLAINETIENKLTQNQIINIAHKTEIRNRTGLGDVIAQNNGGLVIRKKEGALNHSKIDKIPIKNQKIYFYLFKELDTSTILREEDKKRKINKAGSKKRNKLLNNPNIRNFFKYSKEFALETDLANKKIKKILTKTDKSAAMTMLGQGIFSREPINDLHPKNFFKTKISIKGPTVKSNNFK